MSGIGINPPGAVMSATISRAAGSKSLLGLAVDLIAYGFGGLHKCVANGALFRQMTLVVSVANDNETPSANSQILDLPICRIPARSLVGGADNSR